MRARARERKRICPLTPVRPLVVLVRPFFGSMYYREVAIFTLPGSRLVGCNGGDGGVGRGKKAPRENGGAKEIIQAPPPWKDHAGRGGRRMSVGPTTTAKEAGAGESLSAVFLAYLPFSLCALSHSLFPIAPQ